MYYMCVCVYDNHVEVYRFSCEEVYIYVNMRVSRYIYIHMYDLCFIMCIGKNIHETFIL